MLRNVPALRLPALDSVTFGALARSLGIAAITQRQAARVAALMYGTGSLMVLISLQLPHDEQLNQPVIGAVAIVTAAAALLLATFGERMAPGRFFIANLCGTVLISVIVAAGGSDSTAYAMLYVWTAIYAFYFFETRVALWAAAWIVVLAGLAEVLRNLVAHEGGVATAWLLAVGTAAVACVVIQDLIRRLMATISVDPLTGAANRGSWDDQLARSIALARRHRMQITVLMIDLDLFKVYNDDHGHLAGDAHLVETVRSWRPELRREDFLARYGGEEFALLLPGCDAKRAVAIGERLRDVVPGGQTCSIGIAELEPGDDPASLMARADAALYKAKALGRDRVVAADAGDLGRDILAETSRWAKTVQAIV